MTTGVTRSCFTKQHQTCKTKTKTGFLVSDRSCPKTDGLRPHHWSAQNTPKKPRQRLNTDRACGLRPWAPCGLRVAITPALFPGGVSKVSKENPCVRFLQARCPSCHPTNSVSSTKVITLDSDRYSNFVKNILR